MSYVDAAIDGGQWGTGGHSGTDFESLDTPHQSVQNRFLAAMESIFAKMALAQEVGMGQSGEGPMGMWA